MVGLPSIFWGIWFPGICWWVVIFIWNWVFYFLFFQTRIPILIFLIVGWAIAGIILEVIKLLYFDPDILYFLEYRCKSFIYWCNWFFTLLTLFREYPVRFWTPIRIKSIKWSKWLSELEVWLFRRSILIFHMISIKMHLEFIKKFKKIWHIVTYNLQIK